MYILAVETTGPLCSVAVLDDDRILAELRSLEQRNHLRDLMPLIKQLLDKCGIKKEQISYIAASKGPGSFTGIRIGVATARALAQTLDIPAVAVPTLDAFCYKPAADKEKVTCGIIYARRGQVYGIVDGFMEGCACMLEDVLSVICDKVLPQGHRVCFYGDGADAYKDIISKRLSPEDYCIAPEEDRYQDAASVGLLAREMIKNGQAQEAGRLLPDYMRKAEAQQKLEDGSLKI